MKKLVLAVAVFATSMAIVSCHTENAKSSEDNAAQVENAEASNDSIPAEAKEGEEAKPEAKAEEAKDAKAEETTKAEAPAPEAEKK
ncbi:MAG: hypothetical protein Q4E41_10340 [Bacteroidales bacterium]|nr:hypothetical protein [Bacteroidales bacterium]